MSLIIELVGLPGAGKSTIAQNIKPFITAAGMSLHEDLPSSYSLRLFFPVLAFCIKHPVLFTTIMRHSLKFPTDVSLSFLFFKSLITQTYLLRIWRGMTADWVVLEQGILQEMYS